MSPLGVAGVKKGVFGENSNRDTGWRGGWFVGSAVDRDTAAKLCKTLIGKCKRRARMILIGVRGVMCKW